MDCTGEQKRIQICNEYDVTAIGCIVIFDGREVISDAGGQIITDKYYQFRCVHKINKQCDFIKCGEPTARQICNLCGIDLPSTFNPFVANGNGIGGHGGHGITWNRARKQLNNAIMLFITAKPDVMQPDKPLYKIKEQNERNKMNPINKSDVKAIDTIFGSFSTSITDIINTLQMSGKMVRNFDFDELIQIMNIEYGKVHSNYE